VCFKFGCTIWCQHSVWWCHARTCTHARKTTFMLLLQEEYWSVFLSCRDGLASPEARWGGLVIIGGGKEGNEELFRIIRGTFYPWRLKLWLGVQRATIFIYNGKSYMMGNMVVCSTTLKCILHTVSIFGTHRHTKYSHSNADTQIIHPGMHQKSQRTHNNMRRGKHSVCTKNHKSKHTHTVCLRSLRNLINYLARKRKFLLILGGLSELTSKW